MTRVTRAQRADEQIIHATRFIKIATLALEQPFRFGATKHALAAYNEPPCIFWRALFTIPTFVTITIEHNSNIMLFTRRS